MTLGECRLVGAPYRVLGWRWMTVQDRTGKLPGVAALRLGFGLIIGQQLIHGVALPARNAAKLVVHEDWASVSLPKCKATTGFTQADGHRRGISSRGINDQKAAFAMGGGIFPLSEMAGSTIQ